MRPASHVLGLVNALLVATLIAGCGGGDGNSTKPVVRLEVEPTALLMTSAGQSQALKVRGFDADGVEVVSPPIAFTSSRSTQVTVGPDGTVRAETAIGSALVQVSSGTVNAAPILVTTVEPVSPALLVSDAQVLVGPQPVPGTVADVGGQFIVTIAVAPPPEPGTVLLASGSYPIAGKVISASPVVGGFAVTYEIVPLTDLVQNMSVSGNFSSPQLAAFAQPGGVSGSAFAADRGSWRALATAKKKFGPFDCSVSFDPALLSIDLKASITSSLAFAFEYVVKRRIVESLLLEAKGSIEGAADGSVAVFAASGTAECLAPLKTITIPITGWLSGIIAPQVPLGLKYSAEIAAASNVSYSASAKASADVVLGLKYDQASGWVNINHVDPTGNFDTTQGLPNTAARVQITSFAGIEAGITVGSKLFGLKLPNAIELSAGAEEASSWGVPFDAANDATFTPEDQLSIKAAIGQGAGLETALKKIFGSQRPALDVDISVSRVFLLARSPQLLAGRLSKTVYASGDSLVFSISLDPTTVNWGSVLGAYNVKEVRVYRIDYSATSITAEQIAAIVAVSGQTEFTLPWTATAAAAIQANGKPTFFAFLVPHVNPALRSEFPIELGPFTGPSLEIRPTEAVLSPQQRIFFDAYVDSVKANSGVTWEATGGSITATGEYVAGAAEGVFLIRATRTSTAEVATSRVDIRQPIGAPAIASVTLTPSAPSVGSQVIFTANGANLQSGYRLSFPGCAATEISGASTTQRQFVCTLTVAGTSLLGTVGSTTGAVLFSFTTNVASDGSANQAPVAQLSVSPGAPFVGQAVTLDPAGTLDPDGTIASWKWDFGDGQTYSSTNASNLPVSHSYAAVGTYNATLTVTDNQGASGTVSRAITVSATGTTPVISSVAVVPATPKTRDVVTFAINGTNLQPGYTLSFPGCAPTELISTSTTLREFACTLTLSGSNLAGAVTTGSGVVLYSFTTTVAAAPPPPSINSVRVAAGWNHSCAITAAGGVKCWGLNQWGELGDGTVVTRLMPVSVLGLESGVVAIAAGASHTCAVTSAGSLLCWGLNDSGQLGDSTAITRLTPVNVTGLGSGVIAVSAGWKHTCALTAGGAVKCWGFNGFGELGDGTQTGALSPVSVLGLQTGVVAISLNGQHACALTSAGGLKCWGDNDTGVLGDGTTLLRLAPVDVFGMTNGVSAFSAGRTFTCILTSTGGVRCRGANLLGELGDGTGLNSPTPVDVLGLNSGVAAISSSEHTCALTSAGAVWCWGFNVSGELGDGTQVDRLAPVAVIGLSSGVTEISAGLEHTCALMVTGAIKCWGLNAAGQLGDGTVTGGRLTPVDVIGF